MGISLLPHSLKFFIVIATVFAFGNFSYMFFVLRAQEAFTGELAIGIPILLYVLYNVFYAGFSVPAGMLSDKIGRKGALTIGYLLFTVTCLGFAFFQSLLFLVLFFILFGLVFAFVDGNQRAMVSDLSPAGIRGTALGTYHTSIGIAALPASLIAGTLWQYMGSVSTFYYGAVLGILATFLLVFCKGSRLKPSATKN